MVQSGGTGKTKIMFEAKKMLERDQVGCKLVLCRTGTLPIDNEAKDGKVFSKYLDTCLPPSNNQRAEICKILDSCIKGNKRRFVLMFDESQCLTQDTAWYFCVVRWWLGKKRQNKEIVAVFAGTTTQLANYHSEPPFSTTLRDSQSDSFESGKLLYAPFHEITTTGLVAVTTPHEVSQASTDCNVAVQYGQPLFARMQITHKEKWEEEGWTSAIMKHVVGEKESEYGMFAVLASRVQMGQVPFELASKLVASTYTNLTCFFPENKSFADITFFPVPVCARLAMSLMLEECNITGDKVHVGKSPRC